MHDFFLGIQGQKNALKILTKLHSQKRIPNALLFSGIEGSGRFAAAINFLKMINETASNFYLNKIEQLSEPHVKLILPLPRGKGEDNSDPPTAKLSQEIIESISSEIKEKAKNPFHKIEIPNANNIKINSIREINKIISLSFDEIPYRGIIISDAHRMSIEAQNAFLKNLEEPPNGIVYILITDNPDNLLSTIKSRCWEINFSPLSKEDIRKILEENFSLEADKFSEVLPFANGSVTNALFLFENDFQKYLSRTILILRYSLAKKFHTAVNEFNEILNQNSSKSFQIIIDLIITWLNDTQKYKHDSGEICFHQYQDTLEKFNLRFGNTDINSVINKLVEFRNSTYRNINLNILVMNVIFELASIGMNTK